jgi:hypothetical protein
MFSLSEVGEGLFELQKKFQLFFKAPPILLDSCGKKLRLDKFRFFDKVSPEGPKQLLKNEGYNFFSTYNVAGHNKNQFTNYYKINFYFIINYLFYIIKILKKKKTQFNFFNFLKYFSKVSNTLQKGRIKNFSLKLKKRAPRKLDMGTKILKKKTYHRIFFSMVLLLKKNYLSKLKLND